MSDSFVINVHVPNELEVSSVDTLMHLLADRLNQLQLKMRDISTDQNNIIKDALTEIRSARHELLCITQSLDPMNQAAVKFVEESKAIINGLVMQISASLEVDLPEQLRVVPTPVPMVEKFYEDVALKSCSTIASSTGSVAPSSSAVPSATALFIEIDNVEAADEDSEDEEYALCDESKTNEHGYGLLIDIKAEDAQKQSPLAECLALHKERSMDLLQTHACFDIFMKFIHGHFSNTILNLTPQMAQCETFEEVLKLSFLCAQPATAGRLEQLYSEYIKNRNADVSALLSDDSDLYPNTFKPTGSNATVAATNSASVSGSGSASSSGRKTKGASATRSAAARSRTAASSTATKAGPTAATSVMTTKRAAASSGPASSSRAGPLSSDGATSATPQELEFSRYKLTRLRKDVRPALELYGVNFDAVSAQLERAGLSDVDRRLRIMQIRLEKFHRAILQDSSIYCLEKQHLQPIFTLFLKDLLEEFRVPLVVADATGVKLAFNSVLKTGEPVQLHGFADVFAIKRGNVNSPSLESLTTLAHAIYELKTLFGALNAGSGTATANSVRSQSVAQSESIMRTKRGNADNNAMLVGMATDLITAFLTLSFLDHDGKIFHLTTQRVVGPRDLILLCCLTVVDPHKVDWNQILVPLPGRSTVGLHAYLAKYPQRKQSTQVRTDPRGHGGSGAAGDGDGGSGKDHEPSQGGGGGGSADGDGGGGSSSGNAGRGGASGGSGVAGAQWNVQDLPPVRLNPIWIIPKIKKEVKEHVDIHRKAVLQNIQNVCIADKLVKRKSVRVHFADNDKENHPLSSY